MRRFFAALFSLGVLTIVGVLWLAAQPGFQRWLGARIAETVRSLTGLPVTVGWVEWHPLRNAIDLGEVRLLDASGRGVTASRVRAALEFGIPSLTSLRLRELRIDHPEIRLRIDAEGRVEPFASWFARGGGASDGGRGLTGPRITVRRITLRGGAVDLVVAEPRMHLRFREVSATTAYGDGLAPVRFQLGAGSYSLEGWDYEGVAVQGRLTVVPEGVRIEETTVHVDEPAIDLEVSGWLRPAGAVPLELEVVGQADAALVNRHYTDVPELLGTVTLVQRVRLSEEGIRIQGWVGTDRLAVQGQVLDDVYIEERLDETGIRFPYLRLARGSHRLEAQGAIRWDDGVRLWFTPRVQGVSLAWLAAFVGPLPLEIVGRFWGEARVDVEAEPRFAAVVTASGRVDVTRLSLVPGRPLPPLSAAVATRLHFDAARLRVTEGRFATPWATGSVTAVASLTGGPFALTGSVEVADLSGLGSGLLWPLEGVGRARFSATPRGVSVDFEGGDVYLAHRLALPYVRGHLGVTDVVRFDEVLVAGAGWRLAGTFDLTEAGIAGEAELEAVPVERLWYTGPVSGRLSGRLRWRGLDPERLDRPPWLAATVTGNTVRVGPARLGTVRFAAVPAGGEVTAAAVVVARERDLRLAARWSPRHGWARVALAGSWRWDRLLPGWPVGRGALVGQFLRADRWRGNARLWSEDRQVGWVAALLYDERGLSLLGLGEWEGARGELSWVGPVAGPWRTAGAVRLVAPWRLGEHLELDAGRLGWTGELTKLSPYPAGRLRLWLRDGGGVVDTRPVTSVGTTVVRLAGRRLWLATPLRLQGEGVVLTGSGELRFGEGWDLAVTGEVPTSWLGWTGVGWLGAEGRASGRVRLVGEWEEPELTGAGDVTVARLRLPWFRTPVEALVGRWRLTAGRVELADLRGRVGEGSVVLGGGVGILGAALGKLDLGFDLRQADVVVSRSLRTRATGELRLQGDWTRRLLLTGAVELSRLRYRERISWEQAVLGLRRRAAEPAAGRGLLALDLHLTGREDLRIDTNLLQGNLLLNLDVRGDVTLPRYYGTVEFPAGGLFFFRGQIYQIRQALVQFVDPSGRRPYLDIVAETNVWHESSGREYRITLTVVGPIDALEIHFDSEPSLPEEDILALLSFGVLVEELSGGGNVQRTGGVELTSLLLSEQISRIEGEVQSLVGFDRLEIEPGFSASAGASSLRVTLQKRLTPRLRLSLISGLDTLGEQRIELSYRVHEGLDLSLGWDNLVRTELGNFFVRPRLVVPLP